MQNKIRIDSTVLTRKEIEKYEEAYRAKYVCDTTVKSKAKGWLPYPVALFYDPEGNENVGEEPYFIVYDDVINETGKLIGKADSAVRSPMRGVVAKDGEVIFSRWEGDRVVSTDKSVWIDGGRVRKAQGALEGGWNPPQVAIWIEDGELVIR